MSTDPCRDRTEVHWAPYQEFGTPNPAEWSYEPPAGPVIICATGYLQDQGTETIVVYWRRDGRRSTDPLYSQESLDAAAAEIARQVHGGPADLDDIKMASEVLTAAFTAGAMPQVTE